MGILGHFDVLVSWVCPWLFIVDGVTKLVPVNHDLFMEIVYEFGRYAKVCPTSWLGYTPDPDGYRVFTAMYQISCSLAIMCSTDLKPLSSGILAFLSGMAIYTHMALDDRTSAMPPALMMFLCLFMFVCSLRQYTSKASGNKNPKFKVPKKLKLN